MGKNFFSSIRRRDDVLAAINGVNQQLQEIRKTMATKQELDQLLSDIKSEVGQLAGDLDKKLASLEEKLAAASVPVDVSAEISEARGILDSLKAIDSKVAPETGTTETAAESR